MKKKWILCWGKWKYGMCSKVPNFKIPTTSRCTLNKIISNLSHAPVSRNFQAKTKQYAKEKKSVISWLLFSMVQILPLWNWTQRKPLSLWRLSSPRELITFMPSVALFTLLIVASIRHGFALFVFIWLGLTVFLLSAVPLPLVLLLLIIVIWTRSLDMFFTPLNWFSVVLMKLVHLVTKPRLLFYT